MSGQRLSIIPARAATDPALKPRDLQVLCVLGRHTDDLGWCRKSQVKMADEMGCARSTVFEAVERLVKAGYLERYVQESDNGRDSPHVYRVVLDPKHPDPSAVAETDSAPPDPCRPVGTPAGISAPPAGPEPAPPAGPEPAPKNDPIRTTDSERGERARARDDEQKAVERWLKRTHPSWPSYVSDSVPKALAAALALSPVERELAAERMADYLASAKVGGRTVICAFAVYLAEKRWEKLPSPASKAPERAYAPAFGPVWAARRMRRLLAGPTVSVPLKGWERTAVDEGRLDLAELERGNRQRGGFPEINALHAAAEQRGSGFGAPTGEEERLAKHCEFVPVGTAVWEAWRRFHDRQGWPWLPDPGRLGGAYFPAGGPEGLVDFEAEMRGDDEAGGREAAE